jgi:hypothetical protein
MLLPVVCVVVENVARDFVTTNMLTRTVATNPTTSRNAHAASLRRATDGSNRTPLGGGKSVAVAAICCSILDGVTLMAFPTTSLARQGGWFHRAAMTIATIVWRLIVPSKVILGCSVPVAVVASVATAVVAELIARSKPSAYPASGVYEAALPPVDVARTRSQSTTPRAAATWIGLPIEEFVLESPVGDAWSTYSSITAP